MKTEAKLEAVIERSTEKEAREKKEKEYFKTGIRREIKV